MRLTSALLFSGLLQTEDAHVFAPLEMLMRSGGTTEQIRGNPRIRREQEAGSTQPPTCPGLYRLVNVPVFVRRRLREQVILINWSQREGTCLSVSERVLALSSPHNQTASLTNPLRKKSPPPLLLIRVSGGSPLHPRRRAAAVDKRQTPRLWQTRQSSTGNATIHWVPDVR